MTCNIQRALLSVSDKAGLAEFARALESLGVEILSTGGTAAILRQAQIPVREVSAYTGFPEILDGRVKTLHPKIYGGLLAIRSRPEHRKALAEHGIERIDLVAVNLYPFEKTVARPGCTDEEAIENIDIGGPCMVRAAAKNHRDVVIVVNPAQYPVIAEELRQHGDVPPERRRQLALEAYRCTSRYDAAIAEWLQKNSWK
ncbi:MAG: IMP cyclohydrolase [Planctomycetes bacterium]|nr:IMP cyclohydrolase [Planctomycetota bacterium]